MDLFAALVGGIGIGAISFWGIVAFLGKSLLGSLIKKDLEAFKNEIESLSKERFLRFSKLLEVKHDRLSQLHTKMVALRTILSELHEDSSLSDAERELFYQTKILQSFTEVRATFALCTPYIDNDTKRKMLFALTKQEAGFRTLEDTENSVREATDSLSKEIRRLFL